MQYLIKRLLLTVPVLLGVSFIVFIVIHLIPGDPVQLMFAGTGASLEQREAMRRSLGLDQPLPVQYLKYVNNAIRGDFGHSIYFKQPVLELILERMPATIELTMTGLLISLLVAFPAGIISSTKRNTPIDYTIMSGATLGVSLPTFWVAIMLIMLVAVKLEWLPGFGRVSYEVHLERVTGFYILDSLLTRNMLAFKDTIAHMILPALTLGIGSATFITRLVRSSMLEEISKNYVRTARAKGVPERSVISHHALRNALIPVMSLIGVLITSLLSGAVVTETIYAYPGIGRLVIQAVNTRDFPVVQGVILFFALITLIVNIITDALYVVVDPRIGHM